MESLSFVQGVLSVIGMLMVVGLSWVIRETIQLKNEINSIIAALNDIEQKSNFRMDRESEEVQVLIEQMYRDMDSRFDKFESRVIKQNTKKEN